MTEESMGSQTGTQDPPATTGAGSAFAFEEGQGTDTGGLTQSDTSGAATLKDKAMTRLHSEADARKSMVSGQLKQVSGTLHAVGNGQAGDEAPQWLSNGVRQASQFIDQLAEKIETQDTAALVEDVRGYARANPALFLGACALAGFAVARLFAAGGSSSVPEGQAQ